MILEVAMLQVESGMDQDFGSALRQASKIISHRNGYISLQLQRCIEVPGQYLLLVQWTVLESHLAHFRQSAEYHDGSGCCITFMIRYPWSNISSG